MVGFIINLQVQDRLGSKMDIVEFDCNNSIDKDFLINLTTVDANFPWFKILNSVPNKDNNQIQTINYENCGLYAHVLQCASEDEKIPGKINSPFYYNFYKSFLSICQEKNIQPTLSYRMCVNSTTKFQAEQCPIHIDHEFEHYNFIWYMTDTDAATLIYDYDKNLIYKSKPKKNKVLIFPGYPHSHQSPVVGENRIAVVCTFGIN